MYAPWTDEVTLAEACQRCGLEETGPELVPLVNAGQLILYGRAGMSDRRSVLYGQVELVDPATSSAILKGERYSDVVAVPALRSVCRVKLVAGRSLSEVFRKYVLSDPEVIALSFEAMRLKPILKNVFVHGWHTPFGVREWPVDLDYSVLGGLERLEAIGFLADPEPAAVVDAIDALQDRYGALLMMLRQDEIEAYGLAIRPGDPHVLMRSVWAHNEFEINPLKGDVYSENPDCQNPRYDRLMKRWTAVMFRRTDRSIPVAPMAPGVIARDAFHVNSIEYADVRQSEKSKLDPPRTLEKRTPERESIKAAIAALWPSGIPNGLPVQRRDQKILQWQKANGQVIVSAKSISRFVARMKGELDSCPLSN